MPGRPVLTLLLVFAIAVPEENGLAVAGSIGDTLLSFLPSWSWLGLHATSSNFSMPPDTRPTQCQRSFENADLARNTTVSIIIPYLRESWDLFRDTMQSILYFTPDALVKEFILISDGNPPELTYEQLLINMSSKVVVLKNSERLGLIKTKMKAVLHATGDVLVFMEPHCIVNRDWLQPLLVHLAEFPKALVQPHLDVIPQHNKRYEVGSAGIWRFEWNLNLIYSQQPDPAEPALSAELPRPSPATSGGIFAIRRGWWNTLRFFDAEMLEWGGDHVEASMKLWRCGGRIDVHPCSRVGHLFRDPAHRPYDVDVRTVVHNYARLAQVWFDDYLPFFYKVKPEAKHVVVGDVSEQRKLRDALHCKPMSWYLRYVDPEMEWEAARVCIPGASRQRGGCARSRPASGRSTVDVIMPVEKWQRRRSEVLAGLIMSGTAATHEL